MQEPISTVAWECGERDCLQQWHKATYWVDDTSDTGYTVDKYTDGDHEEAERAELPSAEEEERSWLEYSRYVAGSGKDPLEEFLVQRRIDVKESWKFHFKERGSKIILVEARHGKKVYRAGQLDQMPEAVLTYTTADPKTGITDIPPEPRPIGWVSEVVEYKIPRPEEEVRADLREAAHQHLRDSGIRDFGPRRPGSRKDWSPRFRSKRKGS